MATRVASDGAGRDLRRPGAAELQSLRYAEDVRRLYRQLQRAICQSLLGLANALEAKDPYTRGHSDRVTRYSLLIAKEMNLPATFMETLQVSAQLHDVGKIGIEDHILKKPGALTEEEFEVMKTHTTKGANILRPVTQLAEMLQIGRAHV